MIEKRCFTKEWLDECRAQAGRADPGLLEKSIYAFELLGRLQTKGLPFVFKGGTSMLLLLDEFRRLSIDVDIVCSLPRADIEQIVREIAAEGPFLGVEPDARDPNRLPRRHHYTFRFESVVDARNPASLQLDVLEDDNHYPEIQQRVLASRFVLPAEAIEVAVPTIEGLLADKLTAFAPNTIGVPYNAFKASIKIAKHVCDIGELFGKAEHGDRLAKAYEHVFHAENGYRGNGFTMAQALDDTIGTAFLLSSIGLKGYVATEESALLARGVQQVDSHMVGSRYGLDNAKVAASRAARLARLIQHGTLPTNLMDLHFINDNLDGIREAQLTGREASLNRLKQFNEEAFYHWLELTRTA